MRVFVSHSSKDKPAVIAFAEALRAHGFEPWVDKWEIGPTDSIVGSINQGLQDADAGIIVFSKNSRDSHWIDAEVSYLTWARLEEKKPLIPVILGEDAFIPPLLRPLVRRRIDEIDAIVDALHTRKATAATPLGTRYGQTSTVLITLRRQPDSAIRIDVKIDGLLHGAATVPGLPRALVQAQNDFLKGPRQGLRREFRSVDRAAQELALAALGDALGGLCLPGDSGAALANLIDGCPAGTTIEVAFVADDPVLLGLAFEAARLPDGRVLALEPPVVTMRRPLTVEPIVHAALPGPLKILLAVAAPDEAAGGGALLDYEQETQNILDAVVPANRLENCEVRILEVGHPDVIADAMRADAYHVLHLSCHGGPGILQLEDEDGGVCPTPAAALLDAIKKTGRPLPLVLLNACHGGVSTGQTASFAEALLRGGVPAVLAMQAPVSDAYAIRVADAFYRFLAARENLQPSRALADARKQIETGRRAAVQRGAAAAETQPEYATAALFVASADRPLADFGGNKEPLRAPPVHVVGGKVPQLPLGELIGRRGELREALRTLRDPTPTTAGLVLTGIGGVGKSALAGRIMCRLAEQGWLVPQAEGKFDLTRIAVEIGGALLMAKRAPDVAQALTRPDLDDRLRLMLLGQVVATQPVLLVLDDFERNLDTGGGAFLDPDIAEQFRILAEQARTGRLLVTCRYPLPGMTALLRVIAVPPLSLAESRKKLLRLPALASHGEAAVTKALRLIGGHPRMLEFLDALLRADGERAGVVARKLSDLAAGAGVDVSQPSDTLADAARRALAVGSRDILLGELLDITKREDRDEALLQAAVSNLPVPASGLARMLAQDGAGDPPAAAAALSRLQALSLLHLGQDGALVHRWTAEALADLDQPTAFKARCGRAAAYRMWRVEHESHALGDAVEALRNFLDGDAFDDAAALANELLSTLVRAQQSVSVAALAAEVLETLPVNHPSYAVIADAEAKAHLALGNTGRAIQRYDIITNRFETLAQAEPDRADYQRDLSVSYNKMGDLYRALGQGEAARDAYAKALAIGETLAQAEPDRADYQRDLSVSYNKMGDLYRALGQGEAARDFYRQRPRHRRNPGPGRTRSRRLSARPRSITYSPICLGGG